MGAVKVLMVLVVGILVLGLIPYATIAAVDVLPSPSIAVHPDVYYSFDEVLYLEGRAKPNSRVEIQFQKQGAKLVRFNARSDANGEWVLSERVPLDAGEWEVRARLVEGAAVSEWSNPRAFKVIRTGITIGGVNLKFAALSLTIVILLILGLMVMGYFTWRVRRLKAALVSKEIHEAQESVALGLSELRRDLLDELSLLDVKKRLRREERARKEHLLRELENIERAATREIQDIEEKL